MQATPGLLVGLATDANVADIVLWDSHPLALGATPQQVWIDGVAQINAPHLLTKPEAFQELPKTPNFDKEREQTLA